MLRKYYKNKTKICKINTNNEKTPFENMINIKYISIEYENIFNNNDMIENKEI